MGMLFIFIHSSCCCIFAQDFNEEHALQAFRKFDTDDNGYINAKDFEEIMVSLKSYLLTPLVKDNLVAVGVIA